MQSLRFAWIGLAGLVVGMASAQAQDCMTDVDCAVPLACKAGGTRCSQSASRLPDGGMLVSEPVCEAGPSSCTLTLVACATNSECTLAHWACLALPAVGASSICFPEGIVCAEGQTCPDGWSCVDSSTVEESDLADIWNPNGQTKYCFPDALRGVLHKTTRVDSTGISPGRPAGTESGGSQATTAPSNGGRASTDPSDAGDPPAPSTVPACGTLGGRSPVALPWCLVAGLVVARLIRRRGD